MRGYNTALKRERDNAARNMRALILDGDMRGAREAALRHKRLDKWAEPPTDLDPDEMALYYDQEHSDYQQWLREYYGDAERLWRE